jgi:hypothetical protein
MNSDFRISVSLVNHPKIKKLMRRCGDIAFYNLICFWSYVAQNKPNGDITGLDPDDIEIAACWSGQCSELYQAMLDLCLIEIVDGKRVVHDWKEHNGYAYHAKERSERAKHAAEARWGRKNNANSMPRALPEDAQSNAPSPAPSPAPAPYSNKDRKPKKKPPADPIPKSKHFTNRVAPMVTEIEAAANKILKLAVKDGRPFQPYQWITNKTNKRGNPAAILDVLKALIKQWDLIENPWPYADKAFKLKNAKYNERDSISDSEAFKISEQNYADDYIKLWNDLIKNKFQRDKNAK